MGNKTNGEKKEEKKIKKKERRRKIQRNERVKLLKIFQYNN